MICPKERSIAQCYTREGNLLAIEPTPDQNLFGFEGKNAVIGIICLAMGMLDDKIVLRHNYTD